MTDPHAMIFFDDPDEPCEGFQIDDYGIYVLFAILGILLMWP